MRRSFAEKIAGTVQSKVSVLEEKLDEVYHRHGFRADPAVIEELPRHEMTLKERLAILDSNVAKIEALREKAKPLEEKFRDLP
jgi:hypothetical protein